jgi:hypothetical protein
VGKLIINTNFANALINEPFNIPVIMCKSPKTLNTDSPKTIKLIKLDDEETIVCSGRLID